MEIKNYNRKYCTEIRNVDIDSGEEIENLEGYRVLRTIKKNTTYAIKKGATKYTIKLIRECRRNKWEQGKLW